ncbi:hypothetical protein GCM10020331_052340 [Ectobacillus funiculus]
MLFLPGRLKDEMQELAQVMISDSFEAKIMEQEEIVKHAEWARTIKEKNIQN